MKHRDYYDLSQPEIRLGENVTDDEFYRRYTAPAVCSPDIRGEVEGKAKGDAEGGAGAHTGAGTGSCDARLGA